MVDYWGPNDISTVYRQKNSESLGLINVKTIREFDRQLSETGKMDVLWKFFALGRLLEVHQAQKFDLHAGILGILSPQRVIGVPITWEWRVQSDEQNMALYYSSYRTSANCGMKGSACRWIAEN